MLIIKGLHSKFSKLVRFSSPVDIPIELSKVGLTTWEAFAAEDKLETGTALVGFMVNDLITIITLSLGAKVAIMYRHILVHALLCSTGINLSLCALFMIYNLDLV